MKKILMMVIMATLLLSLINALEIREAREATLSDRLFSIATSKSTYEQGETILIEDTQDIYEYCLELRVDVELDNQNGDTVLRTSRSFGQVWPFTAFVGITHDSDNLAPGTYTIETRWFCSSGSVSFELGNDGRIDDRKDRSIFTFKVVEGCSITNPSACVTNPPQECSKQCSVGYELINPDSAQCYCSPQFTENDGRCDVGEPRDSIDCKNAEVPGDTDGDGIPDADTSGLDTQTLLLLGGALVLVIGVVVVIKQ